MIGRRSALLAAAGGATGAMVARALLERRRLVLTTHVVRSTRQPRRSARVAQISDLHIRRMGTLERQLVAGIRAAQPDLIVITGDSISSRPALGPLRRLLEGMAGVAPGFAVLGNWDRWSGVTLRELRQTYGRSGFTLLVNETAMLHVRGEPVRVTGVDDLLSGQPSARAGLEAARPEETHLLLSHSPAFRELLWRQVSEARPVDGWTQAAPAWSLPPLMLSGHTHGGQIRLFGLAPVRPKGSGHYVSGWYRDARPHLYVSRGLGVSAIPVRFGAPPELAIFDVELPA